MKKYLIIIVIALILTGCEQEPAMPIDTDKNPKFSLEGKVFKAYSHVDSATGLEYYSIYQFISKEYVRQFFMEKDESGSYILRGGFDSCSYIIDYPELVIYRHLYYYGGGNEFSCEFIDTSSFLERHDWAGYWELPDSVLQYEYSDFLTYAYRDKIK